MIRFLDLVPPKTRDISDPKFCRKSGFLAISRPKLEILKNNKTFIIKIIFSAHFSLPEVFSNSKQKKVTGKTKIYSIARNRFFWNNFFILRDTRSSCYSPNGLKMYNFHQKKSLFDYMKVWPRYGHIQFSPHSAT